MAPTELADEVADMDIAVDPGDAREYELARMRHSCAHLMAEAVQEVFPDAKFGIGPAIDDGFYYDFDLPRALTPDDLAAIEGRMRANRAKAERFAREVVSREEANRIFAANPYKIELIEGLPVDEIITTYRQGSFLDLCRGPHVATTAEIGPFKLQSIAGAYWRGDERRPMLQRIYGTAWPTQEELDAHLERLEEALRRDHRRLGRELDLFSVSEEIGPGLILWHPKGAMVRHLVEQFEQKEQLDRGYDLVYTPHIASEKIYKTSGHLETYRENMYAPMSIEEVDYYLKPMNCPGHIMIYKSGVKSYRDLPVRYAELGTVYRYERSGTLHGMLRVRGFTQDDSHIFCTPEQVVDEARGVIDLALHMAAVFGYDFQAYLATRPEKAIGDDATWARATDDLRRAMETRGLTFKVDEGGGAFYGPKIDIKWVDALGREWTGPTIQVDFNLPERFDVDYVAEDGERHRVAMIHRTLLGSMERFIGGLVEHYAGAFPLWLAPVQAAIIPITDGQIPFGREVERRLRERGLRVELNDGRDRMQAKIRHAQMQKIPYMLVIGKREAAADTVAVRLRNGRDLGAISVHAFLEQALPRIASRSLYLDDEEARAAS
ncbi:MAG: Threonyl-tRNA synthetase [uncultured Thermomicrobiales bacterium]|uniref:Threonine--tRNA ligase n=1 Tax=uncultured Thermomicrobiales bacterium TaxID=1645740 RepID=A0A6J4UG51_9BACT|nr:MAG: Threonyl-tRNA synthetase [uncultured Thermomicrobiales bacterium]